MTAPGKRVFVLGLLLLLIAAPLISWVVTRHGEGLGSDSIHYICYARTAYATGTMQSLDGQGGLTTRIDWAPLYPLALAFLSHLSGDALDSARWYNTLFFPLSVLLVVLLARRASQSNGVALAVGAVCLLAPNIMQAHLVAMSDSFCLLWWLLSFWLLIGYSEHGHRTLLIGAALAAAVALLTRHAAIAQIGAGFLFLCWFSPRPKWSRLVDAVLFGALACLPLALYQFTHPTALLLHASTADHAEVVRQTFAERRFGFYGLPRAQLLAAIRVAEEWLCPIDGLPLLVRGPLVLLFLAGGMLAIFTTRPTFSTRAAPSGVLFLFFANVILYEGMVLFTWLFLDPLLEPNSRTHIAAYISGLIFLAYAFGQIRRSHPTPASTRPRFSSLLRGLAIFYLVIAAVGAVVWLRQADTLHLGWAGAAWRNNPATPFIRNLPTQTPIYTNQIKLIYYLTGRTDTITIPIREQSTTHELNAGYEEAMTQLLQTLRQTHAPLVMFTEDSPSLQRFVSVPELKANPALRVSAETPDAVVFLATTPNRD